MHPSAMSHSCLREGLPSKSPSRLREGHSSLSPSRLREGLGVGLSSRTTCSFTHPLPQVGGELQA